MAGQKMEGGGDLVAAALWEPRQGEEMRGAGRRVRVLIAMMVVVMRREVRI